MEHCKSSAAKGKVHSNTSLPQETTEKKRKKKKKKKETTEKSNKKPNFTPNATIKGRS